jgi:hypothetical protein
MEISLGQVLTGTCDCDREQPRLFQLQGLPWTGFGYKDISP